MKELVALLVLSLLNVAIAVRLWLEDPAYFLLYLGFLIGTNVYYLWRAEQIVDFSEKKQKKCCSSDKE